MLVLTRKRRRKMSFFSSKPSSSTSFSCGNSSPYFSCHPSLLCTVSSIHRKKNLSCALKQVGNIIVMICIANSLSSSPDRKIDFACFSSSSSPSSPFSPLLFYFEDNLGGWFTEDSTLYKKVWWLVLGFLLDRWVDDAWSNALMHLSLHSHTHTTHFLNSAHTSFIFGVKGTWVSSSSFV